jgi:hypothetical protein
MRSGRGAHGVLRDVQRQADVSRQPRKDAGQVVPGSGAEIGHAAGTLRGGTGLPVTDEGRGGVGQGCGDGREMPETEELAAGAHHRGRVAGACGSSRLEQADIALPRDVEAVPGVATQRPGRPA